MRLAVKQWAMGHPCIPYSLLTSFIHINPCFQGIFVFPFDYFQLLLFIKSSPSPPPLHSSFPNSRLSKVHTSSLTSLFDYSTTTPPLAAGYNTNTLAATKLVPHPQQFRFCNLSLEFYLTCCSLVERLRFLHNKHYGCLQWPLYCH
jgi:hypothetical protein